MTLLPLSPLLASALVGIAMATSPAPSTAVRPAPPPLAKQSVSADGGWRRLLIEGAAPVFQRPSGPLRA